MTDPAPISTSYEGRVRLVDRERHASPEAKAYFRFDGIAAEDSGYFSAKERWPLIVSISWYEEPNDWALRPTFVIEDDKLKVRILLEGPQDETMIRELWRLTDAADETDISFTVVHEERQGRLRSNVLSLLIGTRVLP